jgi:hypothetical protein
VIRACSLPPLGVVGWDDPRPKARDRREHPAEVHRVEAPIDHGQAWGTTTATAGLGPGCWWALLYGIKPPGVELWCARASLCGTCAYSLQQHILRALHIQVLPETLVHLRVHQIPGQLPRFPTKQSSSTQPPLVCGQRVGKSAATRSSPGSSEGSRGSQARVCHRRWRSMLRGRPCAWGGSSAPLRWR